jgi:hypothetical protein
MQVEATKMVGRKTKHGTDVQGPGKNRHVRRINRNTREHYPY